jgi:hypothetical protein
VDAAGGLSSLSLGIAAAVVFWISSRQTPNGRMLGFFGLGVAALTLLSVWQLAFGIERALAEVALLPEPLRADARAILSSGRAFASQVFPGHLAALQATALPLMLACLKYRERRIVGIVGSALCFVGIALTRSPIGAGLAILVTVALVAGKRRGFFWAVPIVAVAVLLITVTQRRDVLALEPVTMRVENFKTAIWVWSTAPFSGVGWGGYGQSCQAVPFEVGNHPVHAHNLPLEWLADLGIVGGIAAVAFFVWLVRLIKRLWSDHPHVAVAIAVIPLHNLVDFSLYFSGVAIPWVVLVGWGHALARESDPVPKQHTRGRLFAVSLTAVCAAVALAHGASRVIEDSVPMEGTASQRVVVAHTSAKLAPWRLSPKLVLAMNALDSDIPEDRDLAATVLADAQRFRPRSASIASLRARSALSRGELAHAFSLTWWASREQPYRDEYMEFHRDLVRQLEGSTGVQDR